MKEIVALRLGMAVSVAFGVFGYGLGNYIASIENPSSEHFVKDCTSNGNWVILSGDKEYCMKNPDAHRIGYHEGFTDGRELGYKAGYFAGENGLPKESSQSAPEREK